MTRLPNVRPATGRRGGLSRYLAPHRSSRSLLRWRRSPWRASAAITRDEPALAITRHASPRRPPPYWIVRPGDTFTEIAAKTGSERRSAAGVQPGRRPAEPRAWTATEAVAASAQATPQGHTGWDRCIGRCAPASRSGRSPRRSASTMLTLEQLNPRLKPATLWPGDRLRLRPPLLASSSLARLAGGSPGTLSW